MKYAKSLSLFNLQGRGYLTLQIPDLSLEVTANLNVYAKEEYFSEYPNEWFYRINSKGVACNNGYLFFSRIGYEANKEELALTWARSDYPRQDMEFKLGPVPNDEHERVEYFYAYCEKHFERLKNRQGKEITKLSEKLRMLSGIFSTMRNG